MQLLIVSAHPLFYAALSEQIKQALALSCARASHAAEAAIMQASLRADMVISTEGALPLTSPVYVLERPVRLRQLLAHIRDVMHKPDDAGTAAFGKGFVLNTRLKQISHATGGMVDVTDKEMQLLQALMAKPGAALAKELLLRDVWGFDGAVDTHTLETHIYRLRGKLREISGQEQAIAMNDGGYCLPE